MPGSGAPSPPILPWAGCGTEYPPAQVRALSEALGVVSVAPGVGLPVREVSLMQSDLRPSGAVYTRLHSAGAGWRVVSFC